MFPKTGSRLPSGTPKLSEADYIRQISDALRGELGTTGAAAKTIMRWTDASDRSARNWLGGTTGPSGHHLMSLARESDAVLSAILNMTARPEIVLAADLHAVEVALAKASGAFEVLRRQRAGRSR